MLPECMHIITQTHIGVWPSTLLFYYCKLPLSGWSRTLGTQLFSKIPSRGLRDSGQVCRRNKEVWIWSTLAPKNRETFGLCSPKINQSTLPHCETCTSFIPALSLCKLHTVSSSYHSHMHVLYDMCTYELLLLPRLDCTSDLLTYNYRDIWAKAQKAPLCFSVINKKQLNVLLWCLYGWMSSPLCVSFPLSFRPPRKHSRCLIQLINPEWRTLCLHRGMVQINIDLYKENVQLQSGLCGHLGLK